MEVNESHPIACESCRNKKSKCDRELPICSQCSSSGANCRYPPINKRGIPSGYLNFIEQRLLETECVVIELLTTIYKLQTPVEIHRLSEQDRRTLAEAAQKQSKSAKIEEWKHAPLLTDDQKYAWWMRKQDSLTSSSRPDLDSVSHSSPAVQDTWPSASPASVQYEDIHSNDMSNSQFRNLNTTKVSAEIWQPPSNEPQGLPHTNTSSNLNRFSIDASSTMSPIANEPTDTASLVLSQPIINPNQPSLSQERWRKYF